MRQTSEILSFPVLFSSDFEAAPDGALPNGWEVEEHADPCHPLGAVHNGAYRLLFPGNLHLPLLPPLRTGAVAFAVRSDRYSASAALKLFFRYDPRRREGYCLHHAWSDRGWATAFGRYRDGAYVTLERAAAECPPPETAAALERRFRLEFGDTEFRWFQGDDCVARFRDPDRTFDRPGRIALDRGGAREFYLLELLRLSVASGEAEPGEMLWPERVFEWPADLDGMTDPWRIRVRARRAASRTTLDLELSGGPADRLPPADAVRELRGNSRLTQPYVRIECGGGRLPDTQRLHPGSLGLCEHWNPRSSGMLPCDAEGPVRRVLHHPSLPDDAWLALGYAHYAAEDRLALAGGPSELLVVPATGEVLYSGPALAPGAAVLDILSPADKQLAGMIPAGDPRRDQAVAFAQNNHFFFDTEPVRLTFRARYRRTDWQASDLSLHIALEDAFFTPLADKGEVPVRVAHDPLSTRLRDRLGVETLQSEPRTFPGLAVGVYHARLRLARGEQVLAELCRAFEVLSEDPAAPCPPLASGIPDLLPQIPDYATETGAFDPWVGQGVDAAHYLANCSHHPLPARRDRLWDVVHLYRRRWVAELGRRRFPGSDPEGHAPERNADILRHADRVYWNQRHDLWRGNYDKTVIEALLEFLASDAFQPGPEGTCLDAEAIAREGALPAESYRELLTRHWKAWVDFFNRWMSTQHLPSLQARLRAVSPHAEWMGYDLYPPYASVYKGAFFARHAGHDLRNGLERFYDGPLLLEDYPYLCGYPLQRGLFMLAAMKLEAPTLRHYPELYGVNGCASDGRVVYGSPPHGHFHAPSGVLRKAVWEWTRGTAWFDAQGFHYWNDDGFNAMAWTAEHYREFLRAWGDVRRFPPDRPLRAAAFVVSRDACRAHPEIFVENQASPDFEANAFPFHDVINTAEEDTAFACEEARLDGRQAGFVTDLACLPRLDPADVHTLVLPPLTGISAQSQLAIRRLHEQGVALIGFEEAGELADLFGVRRLERPLRLQTLRAAAALRGEPPWDGLPAEAESCETLPVRAAYDAADPADAVLVGQGGAGAPATAALVRRTTPWGRTVFFTLPPTLVQRTDVKALVSYGRESRSRLIRRAMALALRWTERPLVETSAGKLLAFRDMQGQAHVLVMEDAHPAPARPIQPVVTLRIPGLRPEALACDRPWNRVAAADGILRIGLALGPHETAHLRFPMDAAAHRHREGGGAAGVRRRDRAPRHGARG